jgi:adenine-specific DNA methylase
MPSQDLISPQRLLIEEWLPVRELGIESRRERAAASALPPLSFLHVWWARRPLVASAGVVLTGLLPAWSPQLAAAFPDATQLSSIEAYQRWVLHLCGIWGDPVAARIALDRAKADGVKLDGNGYGYRQAFRNHPDRIALDLLHQVLKRTWGDLPPVVDPTAGGGSIPFVAARLGLPAYANDLNGVAASVLRAGVKIPAEEGTELLTHLKHWGEILVSRVRDRLKPFFPLQNGEKVISYIWAHAIACPRTGRIVPLVTDWWLRKEKGKEAAVRLVTEIDGVDLWEPRFEVVRGADVDTERTRGTMSRGSAVSPYDDLVIDGDDIKTEAKEGRMRQILYAVAIRRPDGSRDFRSPTELDLAAIAAAEKELERLRPEWEAQGFLPQEPIDAVSNYERGHRLYGINTWADMFSARQLLTHATFAEEFHKITSEVYSALDHATATAVLAELALMQGTGLNYNSRYSSWHVSRQTMRSVFEKHNFAFKWTFAEFEGAEALYPWCLYQLTDAYGKIAHLFRNTGLRVLPDQPLPRSITVTQGNGADLAHLADGSIAHVCMDPPYYDNVMYAELADFFYVWEKQTLGRILPEYFADDVTDKENEAVANPARFAAFGRKKKELADADYEAKMTAIFAECRRVLRDDGVLTVMFTHKRAEAWDTLGMALLEAGFTIETSWPVNTESEHSLHQARLNSAASTIMLVCRKRTTKSTEQIFFEDIESDVRQAAREALVRFERSGLSGVDLLLSTYGPAMSVISGHWPVHSSEASDDGTVQLLRPEQALDAARSEVARLQLNRIVGHTAQFEPYTDFTLLAWHTFRTAEFGFDDARRLALNTGGLDVDELVRAKVVDKRAGTVRLLEPHERIVRGSSVGKTGVNPIAERFDHPIDAVHTACYVAEVDGLTAAKAFLDRTGLAKDRSFRDCLQGLVNAVPRTKVKGEWVVPLAGTLERLITTYLPDVALPKGQADRPAYVQGDLSEAG